MSSPKVARPRSAAVEPPFSPIDSSSPATSCTSSSERPPVAISSRRPRPSESTAFCASCTVAAPERSSTRSVPPWLTTMPEARSSGPGSAESGVSLVSRAIGLPPMAVPAVAERPAMPRSAAAKPPGLSASVIAGPVEVRARPPAVTATEPAPAPAAWIAALIRVATSPRVSASVRSAVTAVAPTCTRTGPRRTPRPSTPPRSASRVAADGGTPRSLSPPIRADSAPKASSPLLVNAMRPGSPTGVCRLSSVPV